MATTLKEFLERGQLFKKMSIPAPRFHRVYENIKIQVYCDQCKDIRTFKYTERFSRPQRRAATMGYSVGQQPPNDFDENSIEKIQYICTDCDVGLYSFLVHIGAKYESIEKVGQYPRPNITISKLLERGLGQQSDVFRKGRLSEQNGFGIGAFAYYRRVVEELVIVLLDQLEELCVESEKASYHAALEKARKELTADKRLSLVKDFIPAHLRPNGLNPISVLYDSLSQGIHARSDEDCMSHAELIRLNLAQLIEEIERYRDTQKAFTERTQKLLDKISAKPKS